MSRKINLWGEISLLESQIQNVETFDFQFFTDADREKLGKEHKLLTISTVVVGVIAGLAFQSWEVGFGGWFGALVVFGLFLLVRDKLWKSKKPGETRYKILVRANVAGSLKNFESTESWCSVWDAEEAMKKILLQMESDALREKSYLQF